MFVTGCHRSGTSLLASLLHAALGFGLPPTKPHLQAQIDNPRGFFESKAIVELNDKLLSLAGAEWRRPPLLSPEWSSQSFISTFTPWRSSLADYALSACWVDKDPRLCITYPAYLHLLLKRVPLAAVIRHPLAVASSLFARDGMPLEQGLALWYVYNYHLAASLQEGDLLLVYEQLFSLGDFSASSTVSEAIKGFAERQGHQVAPSADFQSRIHQRICRHLNRSSSSLPQSLVSQVDSRLLDICQQSYDIVGSQGLPEVQSHQLAFDVLPRPVLMALLQPGNIHLGNYQMVIHENEQLKADLERSHRRGQDCEAQLALIQASTSWRVSYPLRYFKDRLVSFFC